MDIRRPEEWRETGVVEGSQLLTFVDEAAAAAGLSGNAGAKVFANRPRSADLPHRQPHRCTGPTPDRADGVHTGLQRPPRDNRVDQEGLAGVAGLSDD